VDSLDQVEFYSERLKLKLLKPTYAKEVLAFYERNKSHLEPWEASREEDYYTLKNHERILSAQVQNFRTGYAINLWIFEADDKDCEHVIGAVNFANIIRGPFQSCFVGYKMDGQILNKGYMTEAIEKGISIMFSGYKLHRIEANVIPRNKRSLRVMEKLGFRHEGFSPKYLKINGVWEDHERFALLNPEVE